MSSESKEFFAKPIPKWELIAGITFLSLLGVAGWVLSAKL
jgi:hypothetical protein